MSTKPTAFLIVGHSNWGKSRTIKALTSGKRGWVDLLGRQFFVRRMSNDDPPFTRYKAFINRLESRKHRFVVAPYCPRPDHAALLRAWAAKYDLRFFVLKRDYHGTRSITPREIAMLRRLGPCQVLGRAAVPAPERAARLSTFIARHV